MRELIADMFITLDGYALGEGAPAYFGYFGPDLERWIDEQLAKPQVLLMGRVTYEMMASIAQAGSDKPSKRMNELPKLVVSKTLKEPLAWSNSTRASDLDEIKALKQQTGDPMRTMGSVSLVKNSLRIGLVDRLRLMVFPQILGSTGREPIFAELPDINLELLDTKVLDSRLLALEYHPAVPH